MKTHTTYWIKRFQKDRKYNNLRFKILDNGYGGYPPFDIDPRIVITVGYEDFIKVEHDRVPLFVGHQFGINPWIDELPNFFDEERIIGKLHKSLLSGHVAGFSIYKIPRGVRHVQPSMHLYRNVVQYFSSLVRYIFPKGARRKKPKWYRSNWHKLAYYRNEQ